MKLLIIKKLLFFEGKNIYIIFVFFIIDMMLFERRNSLLFFERCGIVDFGVYDLGIIVRFFFIFYLEIMCEINFF